MTFSIVLLCFFFLISRNRKINSIIYIFSVWYLIVITDLILTQNMFVAISKKFDMVFVIFMCVFIFSYLLCNLIFDYNPNITGIRIKIFKYEVYFLICFLLTLLSLFLFIKALLTYPFPVVREKIGAGELSCKVGISFPFVCGLLYYQKINNIKKFRKLSFVLLLILIIVATSKMFFIIGLLYVVPWYKKGFEFKIRYVFYIVLTGISFFAVLHLVTNRVVGDGNFIQKVMYMLNGYFIGGMAIFQTHLDHTLISHITVAPWVRVGNWVGNVYSGFYSFFINYSYLEFCINTFFVGFMYAILNRKELVFRFVKIYSIYPFLFFIFSDLYIAGITQWLIFFFVGVCIDLIRKRGGSNENMFINNIV